MTATLPQPTAHYDSRHDTWTHIHEVQRGLNVIIKDLLTRAHVHDQSKLVWPELEAFNESTPKLAGLVYGTPEYQQSLDAMRPALEHHYSVNRHHPQFHENGIHDMNLMDLLEMLVDWQAACKRHTDGGNIRQSIEFNAERFGYGDEIKKLLLNTVYALEQL